MISFVNDYSEGAHPQILEAMTRANYEINKGYGLDVHSEKAREFIRALIEQSSADIHFIPGGTQTNLLVIASFLRPHEAVIAADTGHINVHETGAIEATGHKVLAMPSVEGKLTVDTIMIALDTHTDEHMVKPRMVYLSNSTELGTIYNKQELEGIHKLCKEKGLYLFLDGARIGTALTCEKNDLTLNCIAELVDVFYIGGTKNGALMGEALVILREEFKDEFRYLIKQRGAMLAKGFIVGIQFEELFRDELYFTLAQHANRMAGRIATVLKECGYTLYTQPVTNQLFVVLADSIIRILEKKIAFLTIERYDDMHSVIRLVTSWATTEESVDELCGVLRDASCHLPRPSVTKGGI